MLKAISLGSSVLLGLLAVAASVQGATNGKWYPGIQCQKGTGSYFESMGAVYSLTPSGSLLHCPFETDEGKISSAQIRVYDQNPNEPLSCAVYAEGIVFGDTIYQDSEIQSTALTGPTVQTLTYGEVDVIASYYFAECYIPGPHNGLNSSIVAFNITES